MVKLLLNLYLTIKIAPDKLHDEQHTSNNSTFESSMFNVEVLATLLNAHFLYLWPFATSFICKNITFCAIRHTYVYNQVCVQWVG